MSENMIGKLLAEKMRAQGLSTRDVAGETGVAHTTVMRVLAGKVVSVKTLQYIAQFLNTDPGNFVSIPGEDTVDSIAKDLATIIGREPALAEVLQSAVAKTRAGDLPAEVLREIVRYAAWRIDQQSAQPS